MSSTAQYPRRVEGYFKKRKNDKSIKIFTKYTKRFFVLDIDAGTLSYADSLNVVEQFSAQVKIEKNEDPFKDKNPAGWEHGVIVETKDRIYKLYSNDYNFKELFVFVLNQSLAEKEQYQQRCTQETKYKKISGGLSEIQLDNEYKQLNQLTEENQAKQYSEGNLYLREYNNQESGKFGNKVQKRTESVKAPQTRKNLIVEQNDEEEKRQKLDQRMLLLKQSKRNSEGLQSSQFEIEPADLPYKDRDGDDKNIADRDYMIDKSKINRMSTSEYTNYQIEDSSYINNIQSRVQQNNLQKGVENKSLFQQSDYQSQNESKEQSKQKSNINSDYPINQQTQSNANIRHRQRPPSQKMRASHGSLPRDVYGNMSMPAITQKRHRKSVQEKLENAQKQLIKQSQEADRLKETSVIEERIIQDQEYEAKPVVVKEIISTDIHVESIVENQSTILQYAQKIQSPAKKKVRKRNSQRCNIPTNQKTIEGLSQEKAISQEYVESKNTEDNIEEISKFEEIQLDQPNIKELKVMLINENESLKDQVESFLEPSNYQNQVIIKQLKKAVIDLDIKDDSFINEAEVLQIKSPTELDLAQRTRISQPNDLKKQKSIKEKIQDIIDDRGSDLSDNEDILDQSTTPIGNDDLFKSQNQVQPLNQQIKLQLDTQNFSSSVKENQNRMRSASISDIQSSPSKQKSHIFNSQSKNGSFPLKHIGRLESNFYKSGGPQAISSKDQQHISNVKTEISSNVLCQEQQNQFLEKSKSQSETSQQKSQYTDPYYFDNNNPQSNEKLIEMIKSNLSQLQRYNQSNLNQANVEGPIDNPLAPLQAISINAKCQSMNNKNFERSDLFHADASTRLQLLNKWDNKFGKSNIMSEEKSPQEKSQLNDTYEWDRDDEDGSQKHQKSVDEQHNKSLINFRYSNQGNAGFNSTNNKMLSSQYPNSYGMDNFEQASTKHTQKDKIKQFLNQPQINHGKSASTKQTPKQDKKHHHYQDQDDQELHFQRKRHQKTKSQLQGHLPLKPNIMTSTQKLPSEQFNEFQNNPNINIFQINTEMVSQGKMNYIMNTYQINNVQNFNINQLNLVNMVNGQNSQPQTNDSFTKNNKDEQKPTPNPSFQNPYQSQNLHEEMQQLNILDRIRMAHRVRGSGNFSTQAKTSTQPLHHNLELEESQHNNKNLFNQSHVNIKICKDSELINTDIQRKVPKSSKMSSQGLRNQGSVLQTNLNLELGNLALNSANEAYDNPENQGINKNSSSKGKIVVLKPSQITKGSMQPNSKLSSNQMSSCLLQNHEISTSPRPAAVIIQKFKKNENLAREGITGSPSAQMKRQKSFIHQQKSKQKEPEEIKANDTFDYNWDDETINNSIAHNQNKASIKSKLVLSSARRQSCGVQKHEEVSKMQDYKDEQALLSANKMNSVRKVIEDATQISIWD
ncbi:UNKNOWN [Stylonychia lemnae]|uniref:Uncharacterized protein n=1 Tax=Stylonychia lemnae TaxID=5949 RepID=A0A078AKV2_STYLE|nr:UNKNOWN [Stylonychia lemnae]|eukprot:CDW83000.1 UNKNOWN [Stylonychia lemnae]